jgi:hypothetical protein
MDVSRKRYWPFVVPVEQQPDRDEPILRFLESACNEGHKAYEYDLQGWGADAANGRNAIIIIRGRRDWELSLSIENCGVVSCFIDNFDCAAEIALKWLRGEKAANALEGADAHIVALPGLKRSSAP